MDGEGGTGGKRQGEKKGEGEEREEKEKETERQSRDRSKKGYVWRAEQYAQAGQEDRQMQHISGVEP